MDNKERIKKANKDIIERMRRGDSLVAMPAEATWFPPRPLIQKNKNDVERLYGIQPERIRLVNETEAD